MPAARYPLYVAGAARVTTSLGEVRSKFTGGRLTHVSLARPAEIEEARAAAERAPRRPKAPARQARGWAERLAARLRECRVDLTHDLCEESGRPLSTCEAELTRAVRMLEGRAHDPNPPRPLSPGQEVEVLLLPRGLGLDRLVELMVLPILEGHRLLVCPHPCTPLTVLELGDLLVDLHLPPGSWSILPLDEPGRLEVASDPTLRVRWASLESGGHRAADGLREGRPAALLLQEADLPAATEWLLDQGYRRPFPPLGVIGVVTRDPERLLARLRATARGLISGNPQDDGCSVCCLEDLALAKRAQLWLREVSASGGQVLAGGHVQGITMTPTLAVPGRDPTLCPAPPTGLPALLVQTAATARALIRSVPALVGVGTQVCIWRDDELLARLAREEVSPERLTLLAGDRKFAPTRMAGANRTRSRDTIPAGS